jgi:hypothetical protein
MIGFAKTSEVLARSHSEGKLHNDRWRGMKRQQKDDAAHMLFVGIGCRQAPTDGKAQMCVRDRIETHTCIVNLFPSSFARPAEFKTLRLEQLGGRQKPRFIHDSHVFALRSREADTRGRSTKQNYREKQTQNARREREDEFTFAVMALRLPKR